MIPISNVGLMRLFSPWPMADEATTAALGDVQAEISSIIDPLARGDMEPLLARLQADQSPEDERSFWTRYWPQWVRDLGPYQGIETAGTVAYDDEVRTLGLIRFERGPVAFSFVHSAENRLYSDWIPQLISREAFLAPQADGSFLVHHPHTGRTIPVRFEQGLGGLQLVVGGGASPTVAPWAPS